MLICHDQRSGTGCGAENPDTATQCINCHRSLRFALHLHDPGTLIRRYRVIRIIGRGGFGAVYVAEDIEHSGMRVALKETFNPDSIHGFQREFATLSRLQHDHLPAYYEMFEEEGNGYLVMEFVPGQSLEDVLQRKHGPLVEGQVMGYAMQLCDVLAYLQRQTPPLVHRDIKPANVRLTPDGLIKLVDFGLVKAGIGTTVMSQRALSPAFAPIEQWGVDAQHTTPRSDIYSLGATLYALLTGQTPLPAPQRVAVTPDPLLPLQQANPHVSPHVASAVMQALAVRADERFSDIISFKQALLGQSAAFAATDTTILVQPSPVHTRRPRLFVSVFVVGIAVLMLFLGIGGYLLRLWDPYDRTRPNVINLFSPPVQTSAERESLDATTDSAQITSTALAQAGRQSESPQTTVEASTRSTQQAATARTFETEQALVEALPARLAERFQRAIQWPVVFDDTFDSETGGWYTGDYSNERIDGTISIGNGAHRWQVTALQDATWWLRPAFTLPDDFYLTAAMQRTQGPDNSAYGVIFRLQEENGFSYYRFRISDTHTYEVSRIAGDEVVTLIGWTASMAVQPGAINRLSVIGEGDQFIFFINDQYVDTVTDTALAYGQVGIIVGLDIGDAATIETTQFVVRAP